MAEGVDEGNVMSLLRGASGLVMLSGAVTRRLHLKRHVDKKSREREKEREEVGKMRSNVAAFALYLFPHIVLLRGPGHISFSCLGTHILQCSQSSARRAFAKVAGKY